MAMARSPRPSMTPAPQAHLQPRGRGGGLQVSRQVRQLLDLRWQHRRLHDALLADIRGPAPPASPGRSAAVAAACRSAARHFPLADQSRGELRGAPMLARRAAKDEGISAVFDDRMSVPGSVRARDLRKRLKAKHTTATEFSQPSQCVFETVDCTQCIELIDSQPEAPLDALATHRLENCKTSPRCDDGTQCRNLTRPVGQKQRAATALDPIAHGERTRALRLHVLQSGSCRSRYGADGPEHARVLRL